MRAIIAVLDSFGIGATPDAARFGDAGANTFGHIVQACAQGRGDNDRRRGPLHVPNLLSLGLGLAAAETGASLPAMQSGTPIGRYGAACEISRGKDTPSGHWEMMGLPVDYDWGYFPRAVPTFPRELTHALIRAADLPGILGNCHASGTAIIEQYGEEHIRSGKPICYTSSDSVFQIAAHETHFGLGRLIALCETVRKLLDPLNIGRVIARPFIGETVATFERTGNRRDFSVLPPEPTLLDRLVEAGRKVHAIGKIGDIYAHQGVTRVIKANGNSALMDATLQAIDEAENGDLVFTNFVDFDMLYGHRRDVAGYAAALEAFDARIPEIHRKMAPGDIALLTADHGCDPTWRGTDHTRERVPIMAFGPGIRSRDVGIRSSYADIGESIAHHLGIEAGSHGRSFI